MLTWLLIFSNFLFVGSYALLGPHALFIRSWDHVGTEYIITGMAIFAATQIGGVWLASFLSPRIEKSISGLFIIRLAAIVLFLIPSSLCVTLSLLLYGISHSIFYKISRTSARELINLKYPFSDRSYLLFGLTTNLAYMIFVGIGAKLLELKNLQVLSSISMIIFIASIVMIYSLNQRISPSRTSPTKNSNNPTCNENAETSEVHSKKTVFLDLVRLSGFAVPYAVMQALIPIKVLQTGLSSEYNAFLTAINSGVVLSFQILGIFIKQINRFNSKTYDFTVLISVLFLFISYISDLTIFTLILFIWSFIEAYQIPSIEHLIFSQRTYTDKTINRFLIFDSAICFLGPYLAILNTNLIYIHSSPWLTSLLNKIKF